MGKRVWNVMYALGNTKRIIGAAGNPMVRAKAEEAFSTVSKNGWRCWVEHHETKKRLFENAREIEHKGELLA